MHPPLSDAGVSVAALRARRRAPFPPTLIDVRRAAAVERDPLRIPLAVRIAPEAVEAQSVDLERWRPVVVYCVHGHEVSQQAAQSLRERGFDAVHLVGGLEAWRSAAEPLEPLRAPTSWVTRERPKIDRIACPWLIRRFVDPAAHIAYVPAREVRAFAQANGAIPFDIPDVEYGHDGERCSFDAFVARHAVGDAALARLADIVRAADTDTLPRSREAAGLLAVSSGLARGIGDDRALMHHGFLVYDALYAWCHEMAAQGHAGRDAAAISA